MNFDALIEECWARHGDQPDAVAARLVASLALLKTAVRIPPYARLVTHVYGEHLGRWREGVTLLEAMRAFARGEGDADAETAITRGIATLCYAGNLAFDLASLPMEEYIAVLAATAGALAGRHEFQRAIAAYDGALGHGVAQLPAGSPAFRALAIAGNNLAGALEEKPDRSEAEMAGMVAAAEGGLRFWKLAGGWLEEERAEYRLANSLLQAKQPAQALAHARRCVELCAAHSAPVFEQFFAHAALALAQRQLGDAAGFADARSQALGHYAQLAPDEKSGCETEIGRLNG